MSCVPVRIGEATPAKQTDVSVEKRLIGHCEPGGLCTFHLIFTNRGPGVWTGVPEMIDTLPAGVTLVGPPIGCAQTGSTVTCRFPRTVIMPPDSSVTATINTLMPSELPPGARNCAEVSPAPDSKTIYYNGVDFMPEDWPGCIVAHDLETHKERELYPGVKMGTCFLAVSPDGSQLALQDRGLKVIPTEGGESRALFGDEDLNLQDVGFFGGPFAWTPDGRYVLFITGTDGIVQLWRVSAEGGIPYKLLEEREMLYKRVING